MSMPYRSLSKEISPSPSVVSRIRYVLKNYWLGSKLLFDNYQSVRQMRKKAPTDLTRWEKIQLKEFRYDIRVGIPFVALFALPIVGYSAPLLALLAPKYLPSTLIQPTQKRQFVQDDAEASSRIIPSLIHWNQQRLDTSHTYGIVAVMQFVIEVNSLPSSSARCQLIDTSLVEYSRLFSETMSLSQCPREHLLNLHQSVIHSSFLARYALSNYSLQRQLELWQYETMIDDHQLTHINDLSPSSLVSSLVDRGLYLHVQQMSELLQAEQTFNLTRMDKKSKSASPALSTSYPVDEQILNDWRELLHQWIDIHRKLAQLNPISTSFLLHIAPLLSQARHV